MTHLLLIRGGDLRHIGGGGSILLGGLNLRGGGRGQGASTAVAVISWPSICPIEKRVESQNPYLTSTYPGGQDRKESEEQGQRTLFIEKKQLMIALTGGLIRRPTGAGPHPGLHLGALDSLLGKPTQVGT